MQATVAIGQQVGYIASNHRTFNVMGSFGNPGPLGGLLSVVLVMVVGLFFSSLKSSIPQRKTTLIFYIWAVVVIGIGLIMTDSRAAIVGSAFGVVILFGNKLFTWLKGKAKTSLKIMIPTVLLVFASITSRSLIPL